MPSVVPLVKIKLDKVRHLRLDLNAMVAYEDASGKSIGTFSETRSAKQVLYLLWACLLHEDRELTLDAVGGMVHAGNITEVSAALNKALEVAQPEGDPKNPPRSDGS